MKKKLLIGLLTIFAGYALLILARFLFIELTYPSFEGAGISSGSRQFLAMENSSFEMPQMSKQANKRNYATAVFALQQTTQSIEQKYEKVAELDNLSKDFANDDRKAREAIAAQHGIIQEEQNKVSDRHRFLRLVIGVPPDNFDQSVNALKQIGESTRIEVTKTDKTNEFLELRAKRSSLEKTRDALIGLKEHGGKVEELIELEKEVLELESKIQGLGVQLGQFDKENQFCTVRFSLLEKTEVPRGNLHLQNFMAAVEWASTAYLVVLAIVFVGLLCVVLALVGLEKAKLFQGEAK